MGRRLYFWLKNTVFENSFFSLLLMESCIKWKQKCQLCCKALISKHEIPNNIQIPISSGPNAFIPKFDHLVIGNYLQSGIWVLKFQFLFGSGYAELGPKWVSLPSFIPQG